MQNRPSCFELVMPQAIPTQYDNHIIRKLSSMSGQYVDQQAYNAMLKRQDIVLYEVYEIQRPEIAGELSYGISIVHPGKVGKEYFMTKGHFHQILETAEVYYCLAGEGMMVMETPEGEAVVEELRPGKVLYVPPCWAHRSVNTSRQSDLITFYVYPSQAGHDYGTIEERGFRKLVLDVNGCVELADNPNWKNPSSDES